MFIIDSNEAYHNPNLVHLLQGVSVRKLEAGDISYTCKLDEQEIALGFELKRTPEDLLQSLGDGRLFSQLPRMCELYDLPFLVLIGQNVSVNKSTDTILTNRGPSRFPYHFLNSILCKFEAAGGRIRVVSDIEHLVRLLHSTARYWSKEEHSIETPNWTNKPLQPWALKNVPPLVQVYSTMGIGPKRGQALSEHFPSFGQLVAASKLELLNVEGFGEKSAEQVLRFIHGNGVDTYPRAS